LIIEIPIGKSLYKISCQEAEKEKLLRLAESLNKRVNSLSLQMKNTDEKTLLAISALLIEEELEKNNNKTSSKDSDEETSEDSGINEQDLYDAVSDNMENISDYIEKLSKKIQNY
jgi:cell division protein ZapA (FtsZ GTPase activity inhibitor)